MLGTGRAPVASIQTSSAAPAQRLEGRFGNGRGEQGRIARAVDPAVDESEFDEVSAARRQQAVQAGARKGGGHHIPPAELLGPWKGRAEDVEPAAGSHRLGPDLEERAGEQPSQIDVRGDGVGEREHLRSL